MSRDLPFIGAATLAAGVAAHRATRATHPSEDSL
jgi:hypothetical protein